MTRREEIAVRIHADLCGLTLDQSRALLFENEYSGNGYAEWLMRLGDIVVKAMEETE